MKKLAFLLALLASAPAGADMMRMGVSGRPVGAAGYVGPGDVATFTVWGGLRGYTVAQCTGAVPAIRIRRTSDNAEIDVNITTSCALDEAAIVTHCAATTCFMRTIYAQVGTTACTGASCSPVQATTANQPATTANCVGTNSCARSSATDVMTSANNMTPATGVASLTFTGAKTGGACTTLRQNGTNNRLTLSTGGGPSLVGGTSGTLTNAAVADGAFVSSVGVINGASSFIYSGGTTVSGSVVGNTTAGAPSIILIGAATTCSMLSFGIIDAVALTPAQANTLVLLERGYWGF